MPTDYAFKIILTQTGRYRAYCDALPGFSAWGFSYEECLANLQTELQRFCGAPAVSIEVELTTPNVRQGKGQ